MIKSPSRECNRTGDLITELGGAVDWREVECEK